MTVARVMGALFLASAVTIAAQAPLGNDSWHRVVFENPQMRILSVNIPPGTTTTDHRHEFDIATISMNEGTETRVYTTATQKPEQRPARAPGNSTATEYTGKATSHRIENAGKRPYELFAVENKKQSGWSTTPVMLGLATKLASESRAFRLYDVQLALNTSQTAHTHQSPTVVVLVRGKVMSDGPDAQAKALAPAPVGLRQLDQPGQWLVVPAGDTHHLVRLGTTDAYVVEVEVR